MASSADTAGESAPDDLAVQVPLILAVLDALGMAVVGNDGYEADDVIGTLASTAPMPVDVVTGDRDLFQVVDDERQVRVLYIARGVGKHEKVDDAWVRAEVRRSRPRRTSTTPRCAAMPPTGCRAWPGSARRPPPPCSTPTAISREYSPRRAGPGGQDQRLGRRQAGGGDRLPGGRADGGRGGPRPRPRGQLGRSCLPDGTGQARAVRRTDRVARAGRQRRPDRGRRWPVMPKTLVANSPQLRGTAARPYRVPLASDASPAAVIAQLRRCRPSRCSLGRLVRRRGVDLSAALAGGRARSTPPRGSAAWTSSPDWPTRAGVGRPSAGAGWPASATTPGRRRLAFYDSLLRWRAARAGRSSRSACAGGRLRRRGRAARWTPRCWKPRRQHRPGRPLVGTLPRPTDAGADPDRLPGRSRGGDRPDPPGDFYQLNLCVRLHAEAGSRAPVVFAQVCAQLAAGVRRPGHWPAEPRAAEWSPASAPSCSCGSGIAR